MPATERLYYTDCYLREFQARVVRVDSDAKGVRVFLDRTAFYPESGGQPADRGTLGGVQVLDVVDEGDEVTHLVASRPAEETVKGFVDWERRFDHMQQHSGQHILSAAFVKTGDYKTVSFHLGTDVSTIDLDSERVGAKQIEEAEELANQIVFENRPVRISFRFPAEASQMDLRKPTDRVGEIRVVDVEGFDLSACGGTHVSRSGGVGLISIRKVDRAKGLTRVSFVCGGRALRRSRRDLAILSEAARLFSTGLENVPELISKQAQELREAGHARDKLVEELAGFEALALWQSAPEANGSRLIRRVLGAEEGKRAKMLAHAAAKQPSTIALIGVKGKPAGLFFAQTPGGKADLAGALKTTLAKFGGKGGGTHDFAQGGGLREDRLEEALNFAETLLEF